MLYESMIETENSDAMRHAWREYRNTMTAYILDGMAHAYRKCYLAEQGKLRASDFSLERYVAQLDKKPVLAIWGAGLCNDIDLAVLADYADFVLIDRREDWMEAARSRYNLTEKQCKCVNLGFWEIYEEEELYFERILKTGDDTHLSEYLQQLLYSVRTQQPAYETRKKSFDFSVVFGLSSQLNARFAGLMQLYGKDMEQFPKVKATLQAMNQSAAEVLRQALTDTTKTAVICANELHADKPEREALLWERAQDWSEQWEEIILEHTQAYASEDCYVAGSREFLAELEKGVQEGSMEMVHRCGTVWQFSPEKYYVMDVLTLQVKELT